MTKQIITRVALVLIAVLGFMACSPNTEYAKVIPSDASLVVSADLASLYKKGDLGSKENQEVLEMLKDNLLSSSNIKNPDALKKILDNPSSSGLDLQAPAYLFSSFKEQKSVGLVLRVSSRSKASELLKQVASEADLQVETAEGGVECINFPSASIVLNDQSFLAYAIEEAESGAAKTQALAFFAQAEGQQFIKGDKFAEMNKIKGDFTLFMNYSEILKTYTEMLSTEEGLENEIFKATQDNFKTLNFFGNLTFEKGKVSFDSRMSSDDPDTQEWFRISDEAMKSPKGDFFKKVDKNAFAVMTGGFFPTEEYIKKALHLSMLQVITKELEKMGLNIESISKGISGDFTAYLNTINPADQSVDFGVYASLSDGASLIKNVDALVQFIATKNAEHDSLDRVAPLYYEWSDGEVQQYRSRLPELKALGNGTYLIGEGDATWETKLTITDNLLSIEPTKGTAKTEPKEDITKASFGSELTKYKTYVAINFEAILKHPVVGAMTAFAPPAVQGALEDLSALVTYSKSATESHGELRMKTNKENSLKIIVDLLRDL